MEQEVDFMGLILNHKICFCPILKNENIVHFKFK